MAIEHVSDTARWVAVYRAMETERPDAIFRDPFARRLAGERGQAIVDEMKRGRSMAWAMIVRTAVFDENILDVIRREKVDLVVNLACGLDARAWRLDVSPELRWVDVDFPVMIDYKTEIMRGERTVCKYEAVAADLTDDRARKALFARLGAGAQRALVISEGLLIYLTPDDVSKLARDLHEQASFRWWVIDIAHPQLLKMMTKMWGGAVSGGNAPFLFAPEEGTDFFLPLGWREHTFRGNMQEAQRLKREMSGMWFYKLFSIFQTKAAGDIQAVFGDSFIRADVRHTGARCGGGMRSAGMVVGAALTVAACRGPSAAPSPAAVTRVRIETSKGAFVLEVNRAWAPRGADRFLELVRARFFDDSRFFRVRANYIAQFGIAGDPAVTRQWKDRYILDDSVRTSNVRGTFAFAMTGPNLRNTQIYINLVDNKQLDAQGFSPVGRVVDGMDVVDRIYSGYGEDAGGGLRAGKQQRMLEEGNRHLDADFPRLDRLLSARVVP